jgi:adenosylhomocysteine nucleosidase
VDDAGEADGARHRNDAGEARAMSTAAAPRPILIVAPLTAELAGVRARLAGPRRLPLARDHRLARRLRPLAGSLGGVQVVVAATGDGPAAAAAGLAALIAAVRPRRLLVVGVAGGLTPALPAGALVAARRVVPATGAPPALQPDRPWLAQALAAGALPGTVLAAERILVDTTAKRQALQQLAQAAGTPPGAAAGSDAASATAMDSDALVRGMVPGAGAPPGGGTREQGAPAAAVVVDLESAAYARQAAARALPYLVIRAVLDAAEETLPLDFEACRTGAGGGVSNLRVVLRALARPAVFGELWRLRHRVREAADRLGAVAERLMPAVIAARPAGARPQPAPGLPASGAAGTAAAPNKGSSEPYLLHQSTPSEPHVAGRRRA